MFKPSRKSLLVALLGGLAVWMEPARGQTVPDRPAPNEIRIVELQGEVEVSPAGATTWVLTRTNQVLHPLDRLRTGPNSRVALRWSDQSVVPFGASTELEVLPPHPPDAQSGLHLIRGVISFFHRDKPGRIRVITRGAMAGIEGTEFVLSVAAVEGTERTTLSVIDGRVQFSNELASILVTNGQQAVAEPGKAPVRTAGFIVNNVLQWCFYYPAVLDPADLELTPEEQRILGASLDAYRAGDLPSALAKYPAGQSPGSDAEQVYHGALLLSVGAVEQAEAMFAAMSAPTNSRPRRLADALRLLVATVKREPGHPLINPQLTTEHLASSYYEQSLASPDLSLRAALASARQAAAGAPEFGFAWTRVAELEFSFGRARSALEALDTGLWLSPRNAQAIALKGFLLAGQNQTREAVVWFERALAVDSSLGNAWLGRGLCRIRRGDSLGGREDLLVAAALEPQRAELRSYLGKAYANAGDFPHATKELALAKGLDPQDPTAWLYSALLNQERNRINEAIGDLEKSKQLNDNRSVYRSKLLLDQDQAVRSANLAGMYDDAGMADVAAREAARAVNTDYANYSAHLFLANSFRQFADPNLINLRYETPAENEYLLANLLAPASAGPVSPAVSEQEYSRLFEQDGLGVVSTTEYLSRGAWTEYGAQYGVFQNFSYVLEGYYHWDPGQRANNDTEQRQISLAFKQQLSPQDSVFLQVKDFRGESGDVFQYYSPDQANPGVRFEETQEPVVGIGYHHEWGPGVHTLFFATRLDDTLTMTNPTAATLVAFRPNDPLNPSETILASVQGISMQEELRNELEIYSGELQQIWQQPRHNTILGTRYQYGHFQTRNLQEQPSNLVAVFPDPPEPAAQQDVSPTFRRFSLYGYQQWQIADPLQLVAGLAYDRLTYPENLVSAPVSANEKTVDQFSPKAGAIWTPAANTVLRFAYTRSLGGASADQSYRLEPAQVAGFVQSFRSIIPESVAGPNAGAQFETFDLSLEQKFGTGTYLGIAGELLNSKVERTVGAFDVLSFDNAAPSGLAEKLDYQEPSLLLTANQLIDRGWALGARYRLSKAVLKSDFVDVPDTGSSGLPAFSNFEPRQRQQGVLQQLSLYAIYNHPCGFFAGPQALWFSQRNQGYDPAEPGDSFWQFNLFAGYRSPGRRAEATIGLLNAASQDYRLNPLNLHSELPRERTLLVRLSLNF